MTLAAPPTSCRRALDVLGESGKRVLIEERDRAGVAATPTCRRRPAPALVRDADPVALPKACKNAVELEGIRSAHRRDGAAVSRFLAWLDAAIEEPPLREIEASDRLQALRQETGELRDLSLRHHLRRRAQRRHRPLPRLQGEPSARSSRAPSIWSTPAPSISTAPPTSPAPWRSARPAAGDARPLHPRAQGPHRPRHGALPGRHHRLAARRPGAPRALAGRPGLRPWHRPWRRRLSLRARGPAPHLQGGQHRRRCSPA